MTKKFIQTITACLLLVLIAVPAIGLERINVFPLDSDYHKPEDLLPLFRKLNLEYPSLMNWYVIGSSTNHNLPVYAVNIANTKSGKLVSKPAILFHGQHHGEESVGIEIVLHQMRFFLENYTHDDFVAYLIDNYDLWFVPTGNPEGFAIVNHGDYRLKRKNETDTNFNGIREFDKDGIDLNRNYPFNWYVETDEDKSKARAENFPFRLCGEEEQFSFLPSSVLAADAAESPYFKGYEPSCQEETKAMINFYEEIGFQLAFFYHSSASGTYSERIFFPWKWGDVVSPDYDEILHLAKVLARNLPRTYTDGNYRVHQFNTSQNGFARDYIYSQHRTLPMLIEVGGNSPFSEGIVNPSNPVLQHHKTQQTSAILKLLRDYDNNRMTFQVLDLNEKPLSGVEIGFKDRQSEFVENKFTDNDGIFHYFLLPRDDVHELVVADTEFIISKTKPEKGEYIFKLPHTVTEKPKIDWLNDNEAVVMIDPVFQAFPAIHITPNETLKPGNEQSIQEVFITLTTGRKIIYRSSTEYGSEGIVLPWLPTNLFQNAVLSIQYEDIHPLLDPNRIANKVVIVGANSKKLSYAADVSEHEVFYLQPGMAASVDYTLYPGSADNYAMEKVTIKGVSSDNMPKLRLCGYDNGLPLFSTTDFTMNDNGVFEFKLTKIDLPKNLQLIIENTGYVVFPMLRDRDFRGYVSSRRSSVRFSQWEKLSGTDLALTVHLEQTFN
jgi:hypothetical protein